MEFSRQEYWGGGHALIQGIFLTQGLNPCLRRLALQADSLLLSHWRSPMKCLLLLLLLSHFSRVRFLCDPIDGSPPGSAVHGILQARLLEWIAIAFSS